jgi:CelD/BcsL family acetyltransferase involved in cellulose biosynthesis
MKAANKSGWSVAGGTAAKLAADRSVPVLQKVERVAPRIYEIDPLRDPRWAALVGSHPQASVFHSTSWLRALRAVYGYEPVVVTSCSPEECLTNGLLFCRIKSWLTGRRLVSLPFSDHCEPLVDNPNEVDAMIMQMKQQINRNEWKYFELRPVLYEPSRHTELSQLVTYQFHNLNLRPSTPQLFQSFHKDCIQRKIRRAERENLKYEEGTSEDLLQKFYRLLVMTRRRQYLPPQPLSWFRALIAAFGKDLKIRVASKDGAAVASILTLAHKKSMVYKYGASNAAFNNLGGTALLFWKTIQEAKDGGFEDFEMGRSDFDNLGLIAFKERWGASGRIINYWIYPQRSVGLETVWKKGLARRVVATVPDLALVTVGRLLYRHVG